MILKIMVIVLLILLVVEYGIAKRYAAKCYEEGKAFAAFTNLKSIESDLPIVAIKDKLWVLNVENIEDMKKDGLIIPCDKYKKIMVYDDIITDGQVGIY